MIRPLGRGDREKFHDRPVPRERQRGPVTAPSHDKSQGECAPHCPDWVKSTANGTVRDSTKANCHNMFPNATGSPAEYFDPTGFGFASRDEGFRSALNEFRHAAKRLPVDLHDSACSEVLADRSDLPTAA